MGVRLRLFSTEDIVNIGKETFLLQEFVQTGFRSELVYEGTRSFDHNSKFLGCLRFVSPKLSAIRLERLVPATHTGARRLDRFSNACRNSCRTAAAAARRAASLL